jgi:dihydrofolate reductase
VVGRIRVAGFSLSLDGFGAGPEQSLQDPLGKRGTELHRWFVGTKTFKAMFGQRGGSEGVDETFAHRSMDGFGAFILGRNMFGPVRGDGWTTAGRAGGETIRPITLRRSS